MEARVEEILDAVIELLESRGYAAVQVRTVAARVRIAPNTIYNLFGSLDELIVAAIDRWMANNCYASLSGPEPSESPQRFLVRVLRSVFEPWERQPKMLEAFYRARMGPAGERLGVQGSGETAFAITSSVFESADPDYVADLQLIIDHVLHAAIARFVRGETGVGEIVAVLERTIVRLAVDEHLEHRPRPGRSPAPPGPEQRRRVNPPNRRGKNTAHQPNPQNRSLRVESRPKRSADHH